MRNRLYGLTATELNWHRTKREKEIIEMNTKNYNFLLDKNLIRVSIRFNRRTIVISMKVNLLVHIIYGANENGRMACGMKITGASRTKKWLIKLKKREKKHIWLPMFALMKWSDEQKWCGIGTRRAEMEKEKRTSSADRTMHTHKWALQHFILVVRAIPMIKCLHLIHNAMAINLKPT